MDGGYVTPPRALACVVMINGISFVFVFVFVFVFAFVIVAAGLWMAMLPLPLPCLCSYDQFTTHRYQLDLSILNVHNVQM